MTESEIELRVERMFDRLDAAFMSGAMSQEEYDIAVESINAQSQIWYAERAAEIKKQVKRFPSWMR